MDGTEGGKEKYVVNEERETPNVNKTQLERRHMLTILSILSFVGVGNQALQGCILSSSQMCVSLPPPGILQRMCLCVSACMRACLRVCVCVCVSVHNHYTDYKRVVSVCLKLGTLKKVYKISFQQSTVFMQHLTLVPVSGT